MIKHKLKVLGTRTQRLLVAVKNLSRPSAFCWLSGIPLVVRSGVLVRTCTGARHANQTDTFADEFDVFMDAVNRRISMKMMASRLLSRLHTVLMSFIDRHCECLG